MKNLLLAFGLTVALALPTVTVPSMATAQSPGDVARAECEDAAVNRIRRQDSSAGRISFSGPKLRQVSNAETGVSGKGKYGNQKFSYQCIYNIRNGKTSSVSVRMQGGSGSAASARNTAGAILGAAIAGAIISSINKNGGGSAQSSSDDWWSPEGNVSCNSHQGYCEEEGTYSAYWTNRIYGQ